jgi:L-2-hydroxyglutarate oxidase LhgO
VGALHSPLTGIIDSHEYMLTLLAQAERHGATLLCGSEVTTIRVEQSGMVVGVNDDADLLRTKLFVNCAGLYGPQIARRMEGFPAAWVPTGFLAKGTYFALAGPSPFQHLVYPVPESGGLGVHLTLDLAGRARFGPDVQWIETVDYSLDPTRAQNFYAAIRRYWPELPDDALEPAYAGIRPKITGPSQPAADFRIDGPSAHGVPGVINLFGIESPGLTASLALADHVAALVG